MFPADAKLLNWARKRLLRVAQDLGVELRQSYRRVGKFALIKHQRHAHPRRHLAVRLGVHVLAIGRGSRPVWGFRTRHKPQPPD